jgi:hypothetical protein
MLGAFKESFFFRADEAEFAHAVERSRHERERLLFTVLALSKPDDGRLGSRVHHEVKPAEPLHRDNAAFLEKANALADGIFHRELRSLPIEEPTTRSAAGAGVGLGVEAAVLRVLVLATAIGAQGKRIHRGERTVVGEPSDERIAGAAVGAVDEGISKASVSGVEELREAGPTYRHVRGNQSRRRSAFFAFLDAEAFRLREQGVLHGELRDPREGGLPSGEIADERVE